jgi:hypothetical protein
VILALVDAIIGVTLLEAAWLLWHHRRSGRGVAPRDFLANLLSGLCLMAALRGALAASGPAWILACLALAGIVHAIDLWRRWN